MKKQQYYVEMDARDNSVSLSDCLFDHIIDNNEGESPKVFAFYIHDRDEYGFTINPEIEQETILADIQYNDQHKQVGFEMLCPSVNLVFYKYNITTDTAQLEVTPFTLEDGRVIYTFNRP